MKKQIICKVYREPTRQTQPIAEQVVFARRYWERLKGLLGRKSLTSGEGLLLYPCSAIHCFGMRFAIDAVFLDKNYRVVGLRENLRPGAMASVKSAKCVLELKAGEINKHQIKVGEQLTIVNCKEASRDS
jgi:uncharacterized membrane protein (UPF0127 family)